MYRLCYLGTAERRDFLQQRAAPGFEVGNIERTGGPQTIESMYEEYLYIPGMLESAVQAEREGYHAIITGCAGDPGLDAARELVQIPVTGPGESGMILANMLGFRFSVITVLESVVRPLYELARKVGVEHKLASVRAVGVSVETARTDKERTYAALLESSRLAVQADRADVLTIGCASLSFYSDRLQMELGVPVVNPLVAALKLAELLVSMDLRYSRLSYPTPPKILAGQPPFGCC